MTWVDVKILRVVQETPVDRTFTLAVPPEHAAAFRFVPGQYLTVRDRSERPPRDWHFSLSGAPAPGGTVRVTVRGRGADARRIYDAPAGTVWRARPPAGDFRLVVEPGETLVLAAAGAGVTPFRALIEDLRARGHEDPLWLLHSARCSDELLFREEFTAWAASWATFHYVPTVTRPRPAWSGRTGRLGREILAEALARPEHARVYACGPGGFVDHVLDLARALGVPAARLAREQW
jgi:ferredoxin-NADP reductase